MDTHFELRFNRDDAWRMERFHFHDSFELLLALSDGEDFFVRNQLYPLRRGTMLLLNVAELHRSTGGQGRDYERYVLHFSPEYLKAISTPQSNLLAFFSGGPRYRLLNEEELAGMVDMLEKCRRPIRHFGDDIRREKAFAEVLLALCELFGDENQPLPSPSASFARIAPILDYVQQNLTGPLNLDQLAEKFYISKHYLCRIFKEATGFGVMEYIIYCRILRARTLLCQGRSVQEAGEEAGFCNNAHFIRTFHKLTGIPPGRYARENRNYA